MVQSIQVGLGLFYSLSLLRIKSALGVDLSPKEKYLQTQRRLWNSDQAQDVALTPKDESSIPETPRPIPWLPSVRPPSGEESEVTKDAAISAISGYTNFILQIPNSNMDAKPRGCIIFHGAVELLGSRSRVKVDVISAYDPKTDDFKYVLTSLSPLGHHPRNQKPKGGM